MMIKSTEKSTSFYLVASTVTSKLFFNKNSYLVVKLIDICLSLFDPTNSLVEVISEKRGKGPGAALSTRTCNDGTILYTHCPMW